MGDDVTVLRFRWPSPSGEDELLRARYGEWLARREARGLPVPPESERPSWAVPRPRTEESTGPVFRISDMGEAFEWFGDQFRECAKGLGEAWDAAVPELERRERESRTKLRGLLPRAGGVE